MLIVQFHLKTRPIRYDGPSEIAYLAKSSILGQILRFMRFHSVNHTGWAESISRIGLITPFSTNISASKFRNLSQFKHHRKIRLVGFHIFPWCLSQIPNPTSPQRIKVSIWTDLPFLIFQNWRIPLNVVLILIIVDTSVYSTYKAWRVSLSAVEFHYQTICTLRKHCRYNPLVLWTEPQI